MRCTAYCTAESYSLIEIARSLRTKFKISSYDDAVHFSYEGGEVFCFSYGCVVFWKLEEEHEKAIFDLITPFEKGLLQQPEFDEFEFSYGKENKVFQSEITLKAKKDSLAKLAISYGLAQSVKLSVFEQRIEQTVKNTGYISQALATKGKIPLSRKDIGRKIGALFIERSSINLHTNFLGAPDFFWEYPALEPLYRMTANDFDIVQRTVALNKKLEMIHELFEILGSELNHRHSSKLEWIIIILIVMEVVLGVLSSSFIA